MDGFESAQANFIDTINNGPDALDPALFDGPMDRVLLALKAHANTINHARLVALEDTFPRTRGYLGSDTFNALSRAYVETEAARFSDSNSIGMYFPAYLAMQEQPSPVMELASIEWAWLQSYHAAEAEPLQLSELGAMSETELLAMAVGCHPSSRLVEISAPLLLEEFAGQQPSALLCIRPDAEVRLMALDPLQLAVLQAAQTKNAVLGNLLQSAVEIAGETASLGPVLDLIGAGVLVKTG